MAPQVLSDGKFQVKLKSYFPTQGVSEHTSDSVSWVWNNFRLNFPAADSFFSYFPQLPL